MILSTNLCVGLYNLNLCGDMYLSVCNLVKLEYLCGLCVSVTDLNCSVCVSVCMSQWDPECAPQSAAALEGPGPCFPHHLAGRHADWGLDHADPAPEVSS